VLRVLFSLRWLSLTVLMIAAVVVCGRLGAWQWDRANPEATFDPAREAASTLPGVLDRPDGGSGVPAGALVRGSGAYDQAPSATVVVEGREFEGRTGTWVLTPLVLEDGRRVTVLRGWAPRSAPAADLAPNTDPVVVTGRLEPAGTDPAVDGMFVALTDQSPADAEVLRPVPFAAAPADSSLRTVNALYALQWWIFAAFWIYLWVRMLREDLREARDSPPVQVSVEA
jgi:cytochrome oxidase assembly protein ShyY1